MQNKAPVLTVMAAGMGSRFGGLKQIAPIGPNGEILLDFSVYDALQAGFGKVVFIIKKAIEEPFREAVGKRIEKIADVDYVFQETDKMIPEKFASLVETREKPWGTAHAILCAKDALSDSPFAVINADDYYGKEGYQKIAKHLMNEDNMCMCGFKLFNTLTENGTVSRGICETENGYLKSVTEHTALDKNSGFSPDTIVSMNMWGLRPEIFSRLKKDFEIFLSEITDGKKAEFFLPAVVDRMIRNENAKVTVLSTDDKWYGMTYKEDLPEVRAALAKMIEEGKYNG